MPAAHRHHSSALAPFFRSVMILDPLRPATVSATLIIYGRGVTMRANISTSGWRSSCSIAA